MPESLAQAYVTYGETGIIGHTCMRAIRNVAVPEATAKAWRSGVLKKKSLRQTSTNNATHCRTRCSLCCKPQAYFVVTRSAAKWWRRGELNPRPKPIHPSIYARVPLISLAVRNDSGQTLRTTQQPRAYKLDDPATRPSAGPAIDIPARLADIRGGTSQLN